MNKHLKAGQKKNQHPAAHTRTHHGTRDRMRKVMSFTLLATNSASFDGGPKKTQQQTAELPSWLAIRQMYFGLNIDMST